MFKDRFYFIVRVCAVPWGLFWLTYPFFIGWHAWLASLPEIIKFLGLLVIIGVGSLLLPYYIGFVVIPGLILVGLSYIFPPPVIIIAVVAVVGYFAYRIFQTLLTAAIENIASVIRGIGHFFLAIQAVAALVCLSVWHEMLILMLLTPALVFAAYYFFIVYGPNPAGELFEQLRRDKITYQLAQEDIAKALYNHKTDGLPSALESKIRAERLKALNERVKEENTFLEGVIQMIRNKARIKEEG